jgi:hypothetical protein
VQLYLGLAVAAVLALLEGWVATAAEAMAELEQRQPQELQTLAVAVVVEPLLVAQEL